MAAYTLDEALKALDEWQPPFDALKAFDEWEPQESVEVRHPTNQPVENKQGRPINAQRIEG